MGTDSVLFSGNLLPYFFYFKHVQNLLSKKSTRAFKYHATSRFIGDLCAMMTISQNPFKFIYPLKHSGTHAAFVDLAIKTEDGILVYKLFDKRDKFRFFIVLMPHFESNIQSTIFYGSIFSEFLCIGQVYTKTGAFSAQSYRTSFKDAIARTKSKLHQQKDYKRFSKISGHTKKIWQKL